MIHPALREIKFIMISHGGMFAVLHRVIVNFPGRMPSSIFLSFIFLSWLLFEPT